MFCEGSTLVCNSTAPLSSSSSLSYQHQVIRSEILFTTISYAKKLEIKDNNFIIKIEINKYQNAIESNYYQYYYCYCYCCLLPFRATLRRHSHKTFLTLLRLILLLRQRRLQPRTENTTQRLIVIDDDDDDVLGHTNTKTTYLQPHNHIITTFDSAMTYSLSALELNPKLL